MRTATILVSTSLYEGFGLPPLEALAAGTPVVAVRSLSAEEVCGDAALLVPNDPVALEDAAIRLICDTGLRATLDRKGRLRASSFSWEAGAAVVRAAYRRAAESV
jgi:glycosyltransferase involved in cell wall biosynthesis